MGVGRPEDILAAIAAGIDMFDCVMPTRNGRNALAFTADGPIRLRNARHRRDPAPLESDCPCYCCAHYQPGVPAPPVHRRRDARADAAELHNVAFYLRLMREAREAIAAGRFAAFHAGCLARWKADS